MSEETKPEGEIIDGETGEVLPAPTKGAVPPKLAKLMSQLPEKLAAVATEHLTPSRLLQVFAAETGKDSKLLRCSTLTLASSLEQCCRLGLEPGDALGHVYLIPRGGECTVTIGYKGMLELIRRSGEVKRLSAAVFYQPELDSGAIEITREPPSVRHDWTGAQYPDEELVGAYAVMETKDGATYLETITRQEIDARRKKGAKESSAWRESFPAMARKSVVRKLFGSGLVPISPEKMRLVMEADGYQTEGQTVRHIQSFVRNNPSD